MVASFAAYAVWAICKFESYTAFTKTYTVVVIVVVVGAAAAMCM